MGDDTTAADTADRQATSAVLASLAAIEQMDDRLRAWTSVDPDGALKSAALLDGLPLERRGPLHGLAVGVKDIIDVAGMVTTAGAGSFAHRLAHEDAPIVRGLRDAGAVVIGKTATTEFAYMDPAPTRNPWNLDHTPGGSSSGSAAAVAAGMVPVAIGTQTVGSVLRPAAFCGIVGLKPGYGWMRTDGVLPLAWSFDTLGLFGPDVLTVATVFHALTKGFDQGNEQAALRLGVPRAFVEERMEPGAMRHFDDVVTRLGTDIGEATEVGLPTRDDWFSPGMTVIAAEAAAYHTAPDNEYRPQLRDLLQGGREIAATEYIRARRKLDEYREQLLALLQRVDVLVLPTAPGPAPRGLEFTGDSSFCAPASWSGLPAISLPSGLTEGGLPLGLQLVGSPGGEAALLSLAARIELLLRFEARPPVRYGSHSA